VLTSGWKTRTEEVAPTVSQRQGRHREMRSGCYAKPETNLLSSLTSG